MLIGSPPCTPFSQLQSLNPKTRDSEKKLKEGIEHMRFLVKMYKIQVDQGRVFLHEQPAHAKSWMIPEIRSMMAETGVTVVEADQCMYGLKTTGKDRKSEVPAKKPTKFMTNSRALGQELSRRCDGSHVHQNLVDGRARLAARYPPGLCKAICRGIIKLKKEMHDVVRVVASITSDVKRRMRDPEEFNEQAEVDIPMHSLIKLTYQKRPKELSRQPSHGMI